MYPTEISPLTPTLKHFFLNQIKNNYIFHAEGKNSLLNHLRNIPGFYPLLLLFLRHLLEMPCVMHDFQSAPSVN